MVATFIDLVIASTISISSIASAQINTLSVNREFDVLDSSSDSHERVYQAPQDAKSSMLEHESDIIGSLKWDVDWSSSAPIEFSQGSMVGADLLQPAKPMLGSISNMAALLRATSGKSVPDPRARSLPRFDRILLVGVAAVRLEDAVTTPLLFKNGAQEDILADSVARSPLCMLALGALATSVQYRLSAFLIRHNHGRIARITEISHILSVGYFATQNIPAHAIYTNR